MLRRRSLAALRREAEPVEQIALARFLPRWHGIGAEGTDMDRLLQCVEALQGLALPASAVERDVLSARLSDYRGSLLDELLAMGEVVWIGRGALGPSDGRIALYLREDVAKLMPAPADAPDGELHQTLREHLARRGARFFRELSTALRPADSDALLDALWDLVWAGEVTNDTFTPLRAGAHAARTRQPTRRAPLLRTGPPRAAGRWSLVTDLVPDLPSDTERLYSRAMMLLRRHGVLTREAVLGEGIEGGFAQLYPVLRTMEEAGKVRRGYFVDGLGGSQFALPGAVDRLRACREPDGGIVALSAIDPANPYGAVLPWPEADARFSRAAGAYVVLESGELRCYLERGGRTLHTVGGVFPDHIRELIAVATRAGRVEVQRVDGVQASESPLSPVLREAGFSVTPRGLVAWTNPG
jgi:ATP-dependent Lhr-like helicase